MASVEPLILADAPLYGVDPYAALAVAGTEGGVSPAPGHYDPDTLGAPGWSYGPFQLRSPGALPVASSGQYGPGYNFAWGRVGIDYALQRMAASGAKGKTGRDAIDSIVRNFERPANPDGEVARAVGLYHGAGSVTAAASSSNASLGGAFDNPFGKGGILSPGSIVPGVGDIAGGLSSIAKPFEVIGGFFSSIYSIITSQSTWVRVAFFAGGLVLIIGGLKFALAPNVTPIPV